MSWIFKVYRFMLSPILHLVAGPNAGCRFYPSCSHYAEQAITRHGWWRGSKLALKRLSRCHPWHAGGLDEVR
jgi:putative membrane protein insertion efficiency factor